MRSMSSKERMLAAMYGEKTDYVPCSIYFNNSLRIDGYNLANPEGRMKCYLDLGTEPVLDVSLPPVRIFSSVKTRVWTEVVSGEIYPVIFKEF